MQKPKETDGVDMKKLKNACIFMISAISLNTAIAEPLPFGCYVEDAERFLYEEPPTCYVIQEATFSFLTPANTSLQGLFNSYGDVAASLIKLGYDTDIAGQQCDAAYNILGAAYNRQKSLVNRQKSLVRRLRKACGSKCRRIR